MGSSDRLFNGQKTVHEILGAGLVADVILWRQKKITKTILILTLSSWLVFENFGYTLLSFVSSVLLLLFSILFFWAKSAAILNRPAPPLPKLYLSEEMVNEAASLIRTRVNNLLSVSHNIALGKDSILFFKVATYLWLFTFVGGFTDFHTLAYTSLVLILTIPALYERYEDYIDRYLRTVYRKLQQLYVFWDKMCVRKFQNWVLEMKKLS